jgi:phosphoglycerate dehydrogenase-like enzyme
MRNAAIDLPAAGQRGVLVCGTRSVESATAELTWALILSLVRRLPAEHEALRAGLWQTSVGELIEGKVLGVAGLGRLGSRVARVGLAFGMEVIAWSANLDPAAAAAAGVRAVAKQELFTESDIVSLHLKLGPRSRHTVGEPELRAMKPTAYLVNTARAQLADGPALLRALREGWIAGAALDVFETEPLPLDDPLREVPRTLLTPHIGYVVDATYRVYYSDAVDDILAWRAGTPRRVISA